jgi:hypothetical protein
MPKSFDLPPDAREFELNGKKFHYRDLSPEAVFADDEAPANGETPWELSDRQILKFLPEEEHEQWRALRADPERPVTIKQINDVFAWLWEEATGVPLPRVDLSDTGAGRTDASSTAKSRSRAGTRAS